ncbi:ABC transporter substrate-binding protein [Desulfogranum japonicum]|uniref:ABC transporter substrate-binding protein n=1 Tax=Desulfogranum japonicum TaxID=231447 RepID=UPI000403A993|nr:ABC transporter substrate-binding protein [Desulfogranum japonicum]
MRLKTCFCAALACLGLTTPGSWAADTIKIGFDIPLTGEFETVGAESKNAGELIKKQLDKAGGFDIDGKKYAVEFVYEDNKTSSPGSTSAALKLITKDKVLGIIGPLSSKQAVPTGGVANSFSTPMIAAWSTSPLTTQNRPFVFRSCMVLTQQGPALTQFAGKEFGAKKAAVLYDIVSAYPRTMANNFKGAFESVHGEGSVVAFEEFRSGDTDFSKQLDNIVSSGADVLFTPQHYYEIPLIVKQAIKKGWKKPIIGANAMAGGNFVDECGDACKGLFFSAHFAAGGVTGKAKEFVDLYKQEFGVLPGEVAGLTWDATQIMLQAIQNAKGLTGNLLEDRKNIKDQLIVLKNYEGVTGKLSFDASGDPQRCVAIIQVDDQGEFTLYESICP